MVESRCVFCERNDLSVEEVGETFHDSKSGVTVHQHCLYFASGIGQNADENEGIQGFLIKNIQSEVVRSHRGKIPRCVICKKKGATVGCAVKSCPKVGHYPCVKEFGGFVFQYYDRFMAFCPFHCPKQQCLDLSSLPAHMDTQTCCICLNRIKCEPSLHELYCPTCLTFLHRDCLQQHAWSAGRYFFRCPVCNNREEFLEEMLRLGIDIPERDAEWESSGQFRGVYADSRYCQANVCLCPYGRSHDVNIGKFRMRKCGTCGQSIGHVECTRGQPSQCKDCAIPFNQSVPQAVSVSRSGSPDSDKEEKASELKSERKELASEKCSCCVCQAKDSLSSCSHGNTSSSNQDSSPERSPSDRSSSLSLPSTPRSTSPASCSPEMRELFGTNTSPSTGQVHSSVCAKSSSAFNLKGKRLAVGHRNTKKKCRRDLDCLIPAAKQAKIGLRRVMIDLRFTPCIKLRKLRVENYLPFSTRSIGGKMNKESF